MKLPTLRICLLADYTGHDDEGMKKTACNYYRELAKSHDVKLLDIEGITSVNFWKEIRDFQPQIIHYIPGPSILSFLAVKGMKLYSHRAKTVISAMHPSFYGIKGLTYGPVFGLSSMLKNLIPLLKPDILLVQAFDTEAMFSQLGCRTEFLSGGVDTKVFAPVPQQIKLKLRKEYGIDRGKFTILHVGSFRKWRNVQTLSRFLNSETQVFIVGSTANIEDDIYQMLSRDGCILRREYIANIDEVYKLSDCYLFPTFDRRGSIEIPSSVLEAMACNLPVITTRFGALPRTFEEGEGLYFAEEDRFSLLLDKVKTYDERIRTRDKVLPYSWDIITERLERLYVELLEEH